MVAFGGAVRGAGALVAVVLLGWPATAAGPSIPRRPEELRPAPVPYALPRAEAQLHALPNGSSLFVVSDGTLPVARLTLLLPTGLGALAPAERAAARLAARALVAGGSERLPGEAFDDAASRIAARFEAEADDDVWRLSVEVLAEDFGPAVDLLFQLVQSPAYPKAVLAGAFDSLTQASRHAAGDAESRLDRAIRERVEPLGDPRVEAADAPAAVSRDALFHWHRQAFGRSALPRAVFAVSGAVTAEQALSQLEPRLPATGPATESGPVVAPAREVAAGLFVIDLPTVREAWIGIGHPAAEGVDPLAAQVADFALGGSFTGRLNSRLREREQLAYYATSELPLRPRALGAHRVSFRTTPAAAARALRAALEELAVWSQSQATPTVGEWDSLRQGFLGSLAARIESPARRAEAFARGRLLSFPGPQFGELEQALRTLRPDAVPSAARLLAPPARRVVVIVGPWREIASGAGAAGIDLGQLAGPITLLP